MDSQGFVSRDPAGPRRSVEADSRRNGLSNVSYADFKSQVGSYLQPDHLDTHGSREAWDALQMRVVDLLEKARHERP